MAKRHASALKQGRQAIKHRERNRAALSTLRSAAKKLQAAIVSNNAKEAGALFKKTVSAFDRASTKGIIHPNKAAREVSHLTLKVNKILSAKKTA